MNIKKTNIKIILCGLILIIVVISLFMFINANKKDNSNIPVKHTEVEKLYEDNNGEKCSEIVKITDNTDVSSTDDKVLLYLIFGQMKKDKVLSSTISIDDYKTSALKVIDKEYIPNNFEFTFEGYTYNLKDAEITRSKANCEENYVTKLYGYSGTDDLEVDVMAGYVKDKKVYDLNDNEIGNYSKDDINSILDKGTMQVYNYKKINDNYKLTSVGVK